MKNRHNNSIKTERLDSRKRKFLKIPSFLKLPNSKSQSSHLEKSFEWIGTFSSFNEEKTPNRKSENRKKKFSLKKSRNRNCRNSKDFLIQWSIPPKKTLKSPQTPLKQYKIIKRKNHPSSKKFSFLDFLKKPNKHKRQNSLCQSERPKLQRRENAASLVRNSKVSQNIFFSPQYTTKRKPIFCIKKREGKRVKSKKLTGRIKTNLEKGMSMNRFHHYFNEIEEKNRFLQPRIQRRKNRRNLFTPNLKKLKYKIWMAEEDE